MRGTLNFFTSNMTTKQFIEKAIEGGYRVSAPERREDNIKYKFVESDKFELDYDDDHSEPNDIEKLLLDTKAWQAVGKVEGWGKEPTDDEGNCLQCGTDKDIQPSKESGCNHVHYPEFCEVCCDKVASYSDRMHYMIDALAEGKSIEEFLKTL